MRYAIPVTKSRQWRDNIHVILAWSRNFSVYCPGPGDYQRLQARLDAMNETLAAPKNTVHACKTQNITLHYRRYES